jgi:hypothetical protein
MRIYHKHTKELMFEGASLYGANLEGANLIGANLRRANLIGANLEGASLYGADLIGANLIRANLRRANLIGANLEGANLQDTSIFSFTLGKHFCFIHEDVVKLGCHSFKRSEINRPMLRKLGKEEGYNKEEVKLYSDIIIRLLKE